MEIGAISGFESLEEMDWNETRRLDSKTTKKTAKLIDNDLKIFSQARVKQATISLQDKSIQLKSMGSVGGNVSASKDREGNSEVSVEGHVSSKSDDGKTSVSAGGEVSISDRGKVSGEVNVKFEHEF